MSQKLKNFFFDLDGVLFDACDFHYKALNRSLLKHTGNEISIEDHRNIYNGLPTKTKLKMLGITDNCAHKIIRDKNQFFAEFINEFCDVNNDKIALFEHLKSKNGKLCCVTNAIRLSAETITKKIGVHNYLDLIVSNEDVSKNKPDPFPYDYACDYLQCDPSWSLIVEDSPNGIMAAACSKIKLLWKVENAKFVTLDNFKNLFEGGYE